MSIAKVGVSVGPLDAAVNVGATEQAAAEPATTDDGAPLCPGCLLAARWGQDDPGGRVVIDCERCNRRTAVGLV